MKLPDKFKVLQRKIKPLFQKSSYTKVHSLRLLKAHKKKILFASLGIIVILALIPPVTLLYFAHDLSDKEHLMNRQKTGLSLLDQDGKEFFAFNKPKDVTYIPITQMPKFAQQAVIASEDKNFYTNPGVSLRGIARAFIANITEGKIVQGGSTITQELVKNALLSSSRNYLRKYQEIFLAYEVNRRYSKEDTLEMYLNSVYFGEGAFGIENAATAYFGIHAKELDLAQSALLIGLLPAPSAYSPLSNDPERAFRQQGIVLDEMVKEKYITRDEADLAKQESLSYNLTPEEQHNTIAPHFAIFVKDQLVKKYGEERVIRDGFRVKTTLNSKWQQYAEKIVKNQVLRLQYNKASNGSAIAIDPKTGNIEVMVGSYDWNDEKIGKLNIAISPRQPGSSFKPIIYADAIADRVITAATMLDDKETMFGGTYKPQNYDKRYRGPVTARRALANSLNIPAIKILNMSGVPSGLDMAKRLGITTLGTDAGKYGLSLVLGSGEVKLLELTNAYAVFADRGIYHQPNTVLEIHDKYNKAIEVSQTKPKQVIEDDVAFIISSILSDNKARAEVFGGALTISRPAAVKTGTTDSYRDALTVGYTPNLVVGVWVGNNDNTPMDNIAGSLGAAPIWRSLMENFLYGTRIESFVKPGSTVVKTICPDKKLTDKDALASGYKEYFLHGTEPSKECLAPSTTPKTPSTSSGPSSEDLRPTTNEPKPTQEPITTEPTISPTSVLPSIDITLFPTP